jgi:hypothetical protein
MNKIIQVGLIELHSHFFLEYFVSILETAVDDKVIINLKSKTSAAKRSSFLLSVSLTIGPEE